MTITTVLFDLDGTLLDTAPDMAAALNKLRAKHLLPALPLAEIRPHVGYGSRALLKLSFDLNETDEQYPRFLEAFFNEYEACINLSTTFFPGMDSVLQELESANLRWGIITNKPQRFTDGILRHLGLNKRSCITICGDTLPKRKPHPDQLHHACQVLDVATTECLYVGDTITDITASKAANMRVIAAVYGYISETEDPYTWEADAYIDKPIEILDYLENEGVELNNKTQTRA